MAEGIAKQKEAPRQVWGKHTELHEDIQIAARLRTTDSPNAAVESAAVGIPGGVGAKGNAQSHRTTGSWQPQETAEAATRSDSRPLIRGFEETVRSAACGFEEGIQPYREAPD